MAHSASASVSRTIVVLPATKLVRINIYLQLPLLYTCIRFVGNNRVKTTLRPISNQSENVSDGPIPIAACETAPVSAMMSAMRIFHVPASRRRSVRCCDNLTTTGPNTRATLLGAFHAIKLWSLSRTRLLGVSPVPSNSAILLWGSV